jgi:hypothetical protein
LTLASVYIPCYNAGKVDPSAERGGYIEQENIAGTYD